MEVPVTRSPFLHVLPALAVFGTAFLLGGSPGGTAAPVTGGEAHGRLVVVIVDSLRRETLEDPGTMPRLLAWAQSPGVRTVDVRTCSANFTLPCVQTLLEGRESPFAAGLHNFTGRAGSAASLPAAAAAAGIPYAVISDQTLTSLYGAGAVRSLDVEAWTGTHLERDLRAVDEAIGMLGEGAEAPSVVLLHVPGTDKAAHIEKPGTAGYRDHFRQVDARIGALLDALDPSRDAVVVTGDHGHNEDGHHTRTSVALLGGEPLAALLGAVDLPGEVDQVDLLLPLSWPLFLPLPASWEGAWPAGRGEPPERLSRYEELNRGVLAAAGFDAPTLRDALGRARAAREARHLDSLLASLPALACLLAWVLLFGVRGAPLPMTAHPWLTSLVLAALGAALTAVSTPAAGPWLAAPVLTVALWAGRRDGRRVATVLLLLVAAGALARYALEWSELFHTRGGATWQTPVFFATLAAAGAVVATVRDGSPRRAGEGALAFALLCLPSGVYYYQAGQNLLHPVAIGSLVVLLVLLAARPRATVRSLPPLRKMAAPLAVVLATLPLLFLHEAGGWEYAFFTASWLAAASPLWSIAAWWALGAALAWRADTAALRFTTVALVAAGHGYASMLMDLPLGWLVGALAPTLFAAGWIALRDRAGWRAPEARADGDGLVVLGAALFAFWILFKGFFFNHIDFTAALGWFGGLGAERWVFALAWAATSVKYAIPILLLVVAVRVAAGPQATGETLLRALWWVNVKVLALLVAIQAGALAPREKLWELAVGDLVFVSHLVLFLALGAAAVRRLDRAAAPAVEVAGRVVAG